MGFNEFKSETVISLDMKLTALALTKFYYYYDQPIANIIKRPLKKFTENIPMNQNSPNIYLPSC